MPDQPLCVYCRRRPVEDRWRPFCGERCKLSDLGHWLSGNYRVPVRQDQDSDTDRTPAATDSPEADDQS